MSKTKRGVPYGTVFFLLVAAVILTSIFVYFYVTRKVDNLSRNQQVYTKLNKVNDLVGRDYILPIDPVYGNDRILDGIVSGYIDGLGDEYSYYLDENNYRLSANISDTARVEIGVRTEYDKTTGGIRLSFVKHNSPAELAGLKTGDVITDVNGAAVTELGYRNACYSLSGAEGSDVVLTYIRNGETASLSVTRAVNTPQTVQYRLVEADIGYIYINDFDASTFSEFSSAVETLRATGAKGFVIDVRFNGGGDAASMLNVLDRIMPAGIMLTIKENNSENDVTYFSDESHLSEKIVVLQNAYTSDIAEAFSAALQDTQSASIVGEVSRGKGVGQRDIPLSDGTAIRISTFEYVTPNGVHFNKTGITPDVLATLTEEKIASFYTLNDADDDQLQAALQLLRTQLGIS